jgi:hypothetical protein
MTSVGKSWLGAWKLKMPILCPDPSSANGKRLRVLAFLVALAGKWVFFVRFKLFLEPHALRDQSTVDPRLPPIPVRAKQIADDLVG